jgi:uncharacterized protein (UPF0548 family)
LLRVRQPSAPEIAAYLSALAGTRFTYPEIGTTRGGQVSLPRSVLRDYNVDHLEGVLGTGRDLFERARDALRKWRSFDIPWLRLHGADMPVQEDSVVATLVRVAGLWVLNPCRVVYLLDDPSCAAFAYGTLPGHVEIGEERFLVAHEPTTDTVRYEILAISRSGHPLARLGYPYVRRLQHRFRVSSLAALMRAAA